MTDHEKRPDPPATPPRHQAPPQPVADRGAMPADDKRHTDDKARAGAEVTPFTAEQLATPAPSMAGFRQMWIIVGPYKGSVLTMPDAEAEAAKDDHWAVEMSTVAPPYNADAPPDHDHELTEAERAGAVEAANAWAAKVNAPPEPPVEPPPEGGALGRRHHEPTPTPTPSRRGGDDEKTRR